MAEGGYDPTDPTTEKTPFIPRDDDDDDTNPWDNVDLSKIPIPDNTDRTQPFEPGTSSTPSGSEQVPLSTRTRLPKEKGPRFAETSFIEGQTMNERFAWSEVKEEFEFADESKIKARSISAPRAGGGGGGAVLEAAMKGKDKWYRLFTKSRGDIEKTFNKSLPKEIKSALKTFEGIEIKDAEIQQKTQEREEVRKL